MRRALASLLVPVLVVAACHERSGPAPVLPPAHDVAKVSARVDRVAQACAKISSCTHAHDAARERDPAVCVDWWLTHVRDATSPFAQCVASASDCAAIDVCVRGRGDAVAAAYCSAHEGAQTACDGTKLIACSEDDPAESTSVDCAAMQATCGDIKLAGGLLARACISPALCPSTAPPARCDGKSAIISCQNGAVDRTVCASGIPCEEVKGPDGTPSALCEPVGHAHCADTSKPRCDGSRLVHCVPHGPFGERREVDCAAFGLTCDAKSARSCVLGGTPECEGGAPRCDGEALTFCAAGKKMTVSCASLGFGACDPDGHGLEASCAPR